MKESDLSRPAEQWLKEAGFTVFCEVPCFGRCIDMVGRKGNDLRLVELKLTLSRQVMKQAMLGQMVANDAWCVVANHPQMRSLKRAAEFGLGVAYLRDGAIIEIAWPRENATAEFHKDVVHDILRTMEPGGVAGHPTRAGIGPAQECLNRVVAFRADHPDATWQQIFESVKNHYSSARSMQQSMKFAADAPQRREQMKAWRKKMREWRERNKAAEIKFE